MSNYLNAFNFYKEKTEQETLENNLTRALALCFIHHPVILIQFLDMIFKGEELVSQMPLSDIQIGMQQNVKELTDLKKVYAVTLTGKKLSEKEIEKAQPEGSNNPITDLVITINDIAVIIEVKKNEANAISQLKNQIKKIPGRQSKVRFDSIEWSEVVQLMLGARKSLNKHENGYIFINDFLDFLDENYNNWLPDVPLNKTLFSADPDSIEYRNIIKRLVRIESSTSFKEPKQWLGGRLTLNLNFGWASESLLSLYKDADKNYVALTIWPADTQAQGKIIYKGDLSQWVNNDKIRVAKKDYEMEVNPYIKFSHVMGKAITNLNFEDNDRTKGVRFNTSENFSEFAGRWDRKYWPVLEQKLNKKLGEENWRSKSEWDRYFKKSGRNFVYLSLAFELTVYFAYDQLQLIESNDPSGKQLAKLFEDTLNEIRNLIDVSLR